MLDPEIPFKISPLHALQAVGPRKSRVHFAKCKENIGIVFNNTQVNRGSRALSAAGSYDTV
jgi:hypothetical protein